MHEDLSNKIFLGVLNWIKNQYKEIWLSSWKFVYVYQLAYAIPKNFQTTIKQS
jgi:hypothetical protein